MSLPSPRPLLPLMQTILIVPINYSHRSWIIFFSFSLPPSNPFSTQHPEKSSNYVNQIIPWLLVMTPSHCTWSKIQNPHWGQKSSWSSPYISLTALHRTLTLGLSGLHTLVFSYFLKWAKFPLPPGLQLCSSAWEHSSPPPHTLDSV